MLFDVGVHAQGLLDFIVYGLLFLSLEYRDREGLVHAK